MHTPLPVISIVTCSVLFSYPPSPIPIVVELKLVAQVFHYFETIHVVTNFSFSACTYREIPSTVQRHCFCIVLSRPRLGWDKFDVLLCKHTSLDTKRTMATNLIIPA